MPKVSQEHLDRRRHQILDSAVDCFSRQGFHATSMQDIFRQSGLSAGAVYRYFPSKTELIRAIAHDAVAGMLAILDEAISSPDVPVADVIDSIAVQLTEEPMVRVRQIVVQVWAESVRDPELTEVASAALNGLIQRTDLLLQRRAKRLPPGTDTTAVARLIVATIQGLVVQFSVLPDTRLEMVRAATPVIFAGL
jgi:TetR/AcrR family transcriptional regulator, transcriptional repressor of aconitase